MAMGQGSQGTRGGGGSPAHPEDMGVERTLGNLGPWGFWGHRDTENRDRGSRTNPGGREIWGPAACKPAGGQERNNRPPPNQWFPFHPALPAPSAAHRGGCRLPEQPPLPVATQHAPAQAAARTAAAWEIGAAPAALHLPPLCPQPHGCMAQLYGTAARHGTVAWHGCTATHGTVARCHVAALHSCTVARHGSSAWHGDTARLHGAAWLHCTARHRCVAQLHGCMAQHSCTAASNPAELPAGHRVPPAQPAWEQQLPDWANHPRALLKRQSQPLRSPKCTATPGTPQTKANPRVCQMGTQPLCPQSCPPPKATPAPVSPKCEAIPSILSKGNTIPCVPKSKDNPCPPPKAVPSAPQMQSQPLCPPKKQSQSRLHSKNPWQEFPGAFAAGVMVSPWGFPQKSCPA